MSRSVISLGLLALAGALAPCALSTPLAPVAAKRFTRDVSTDGCAFSSIGTNDYFPLDPGRYSILQGMDHGHLDRLEIRVLDEMKKVGGVDCRVVEEAKLVDGELVEIVRAYYAVDAATRNVHSFGEQVDEYENGVVVGHAGSWEAYLQGAQPGLAMPGTPLLGARYYVQQVPGVAEDRAEITELPEGVKTPAGMFRACLITEETSVLEPGETAVKAYAPGVGVVKDAHLKLIAYRR